MESYEYITAGNYDIEVVRERYKNAVKNRNASKQKILDKLISKLKNIKHDGKYHKIGTVSLHTEGRITKYVEENCPDYILRTEVGCSDMTLYAKVYDEKLFERHANKILIYVTERFSTGSDHVYIFGKPKTYKNLLGRYREFFARYGYKVDKNGMIYI